MISAVLCPALRIFCKAVVKETAHVDASYTSPRSKKHLRKFDKWCNEPTPTVTFTLKNNSLEAEKSSQPKAKTSGLVIIGALYK